MPAPCTTSCGTGPPTASSRGRGCGTIARTVFSHYRKRAVLGLSLFVGRAFLCNAITFGFGAILTTFFDVGTGSTGYHFAVIAVGNFFGPLLLGRFFDTVGRRVMISGTYILSGLLLSVTAWLFGAGLMTVAGLVAVLLAVPAERRALEDIAVPLSAQVTPAPGKRG